MNRSIHSTPLMLVALCATLLSCSPASDEFPPDLRSAIDAFYAAVEADDAEARIAMFSDSVIMMPNHWTVTVGKEAVADVMRSSAGAIFKIRNRVVLDADVSGDAAYTVNSYEYTYHAPEDSAQWHRTKNVHIWKRDTAGTWKLHVDIWNSDVPMNRFAEE